MARKNKSVVPKGCTVRRVRIKSDGAEIAFGCGSKKSKKLLREVHTVIVSDVSVTGEGARVGFDFGATCHLFHGGTALSCKPK